MNPRTAATLGAALLIGSVAAELAWPGLGDGRQGAVLPVLNALGWLAIMYVLRHVPRADDSRRARIGWWTTRAGVILQTVFGLAHAASTLALGEAVEALFVLFALGFLLLLVGGLCLGRVYWRQGDRLVGAGLRAVALLGLLAIVVGVDPWHDVALLSSYAAWMLVGAGAAGRSEVAVRERSTVG